MATLRSRTRQQAGQARHMVLLPSSSSCDTLESAAGMRPHLLRQTVYVQGVVAVQAAGIVQLAQRLVPHRRLRVHSLAARRNKAGRARSGHAASQGERMLLAEGASVLRRVSSWRCLPATFSCAHL